MSNVVGGVFGAIGKVFSFLTPKLPDTIVGKLDDLTIQTSTYGTEIPRLYGTVAMSGNVIWLENGKLKEVVKKKKSGGKGGGGGSETKTYTYFATFALALCEGPIAGVRRIWCSDKLIYNAGSDDLETIIASNKAAKGFTIYRGTDDQLPDPRYEAAVGVGNAPAYRGLAYIVFRDFALADYSNTLQGAQFKVEVVKSLGNTYSLIGQAETYRALESKFTPKSYFVTPEKIVIYAPEWNNLYPETSSWTAYEFRTGGFSKRYSIPVSGGTSAPPAGDTDTDGEVFNSKSTFFSAGGGFNGTDGYIQKRGNYAIGISNSGGRRLYSRDIDGGAEVSVATTAYTFSFDGNSLFTLSADGVREYSPSLVLIRFMPIAIPSMDFPLARASITNGIIIAFDGVNESPTVYAINIENESIATISVLPEQNEIIIDSRSVFLTESMLVIAESSQTENKLKVKWYNIAAIEINNIHLADVIEKEIRLTAMLESSDIDVSEIESSINGYRVSGGSIRSALEPLQVYSPFDVIQSGYKIKFAPRGLDPVLTIPYSDLYAGDDGLGTVLEQPREMDSQLPSKTTIKYLDAEREYAVSSQYYQRTSTQSVNSVEQELAIVMSADDAAKVAEIQTFRAWLERTTSSFSLPPTYLPLEPADVVTIVTADAQYELRLGEMNMTPEGRLECKGAPNRAALYTSNAVGGSVPGPDGTLGLAGVSLFLPLDIPIVDETVQNSPGFVGVMTGYSLGWPGALLVRSNDNGQTFTDLQAFQSKATLGYVRGTLPASTGSLIDQRAILVDLISGELDSITRDQMLAGANYAAYGADGRWEIVRFQNAVLQADGSYSVSGFARGQRGTEWATAQHFAGDAFVLLDDPDNAFIDVPVESLGLSRLYRGVTAGDPVDEATDVEFTYQGVNLECLSPVYPRGARDSGGNLAVTATRRSRLSNSWWTNGVVAPLGETSEAYEMDVMSGATVKRTISTTSPVFSYTADQQVADFGSIQSTIVLRIYQLSSMVGRGYPLEVTL